MKKSKLAIERNREVEKMIREETPSIQIYLKSELYQLINEINRISAKIPEIFNDGFKISFIVLYLYYLNKTILIKYYCSYSAFINQINHSFNCSKILVYSINSDYFLLGFLLSTSFHFKNVFSGMTSISYKVQNNDSARFY